MREGEKERGIFNRGREAVESKAVEGVLQKNGEEKGKERKRKRIEN